MTLHFERLLEQAGAACACGRRHPSALRHWFVGPDALSESAERAGAVPTSGTSIWVLSDGNTEAAAGEAWKQAVAGSGARIAGRVLAASPKPVPTIELVRDLAREADASRASLVVGVGSGVITDLAKHVSLEIEAPNWAIGTAASVDAYTSPTAAIRVEGYHRALPTAASELVACDLRVIEAAPRELFLAGLGDLLAKVVAFLDWNLSRIMTGEHYCPVVADASLASARAALTAARTLSADPREATRTLTDAVLTSGLAMQYLGGSRSAASAEHTIAHLWEMLVAVGNKRWDLHGVLVGAASRLVLCIYRRLFDLLPSIRPDVDRRLRLFEGEPAWGSALEPELLPFTDKIREEVGKRSFSRATLQQRLERFVEARSDILAMGLPLLDELASAVATLEQLGYPFSLAELGVPGRAALLAVRNVQLLRHRYSCFDLAWELGVGGELVRSAEAFVQG